MVLQIASQAAERNKYDECIARDVLPEKLFRLR
jgi:hypothetical protein